MKSIVHTRLTEYMKQNDMSIYQFAKQSGIPESTIRSITKKEDYEVREKNILKICKGMGILPYEMFQMDDDHIVVLRQNEIPVIAKYRKLQENEKIRVQGYIDALLSS